MILVIFLLKHFDALLPLVAVDILETIFDLGCFCHMTIEDSRF
jgi:hypothetical protein